VATGLGSAALAERVVEVLGGGGHAVLRAVQVGVQVGEHLVDLLGGHLLDLHCFLLRPGGAFQVPRSTRTLPARGE
jgi:hypothetical protein